MEQRGLSAEGMTDEQLLEISEMFGQMFRDTAPMTAAQAATVILDGVREDRWRILVGDDAVALDQAVRADPEAAYGPEGLALGPIIGTAWQIKNVGTGDGWWPILAILHPQKRWLA